MKPGDAPGLVLHIVEEDAALGIRQLGTGIGDRLDEAPQIELGGECLADALERSDQARLFAHGGLASAARLLHSLAIADVDEYGHRAE